MTDRDIRRAVDAFFHDIDHRVLGCLRKVMLPTALGTSLVLSSCGGIRNVAVSQSDGGQTADVDAYAPVRDAAPPDKPAPVPDVTVGAVDAAIDSPAPVDAGLGEFTPPPHLSYAVPFPPPEAGPTKGDQ